MTSERGRAWLARLLLPTESMKGCMRLFGAAAIFAASALAQVDPRSFSLHVTQHETQEKEYTAKRSDGENDSVIRRVRALDISCRLIGSTPKGVTIEWWFFSKEPLNNKVRAWSTGSKQVVVGPAGAKVRAVSEPLATETSFRSEGLRRYRSESGAKPHGWAVRVTAAGKLVQLAESSPGLIKLVQ